MSTLSEAVKVAGPLKPGGIYAIKIDARLTQAELQRVRGSLEMIAPGVRFIILDSCSELVDAADLREAIASAVTKAVDRSLRASAGSTRSAVIKGRQG